MSHELHRLFQIMGRPAYVKSASEHPHRDPAGYPSQTREQTYTSWCRALNDGRGADVMAKLAEMGRFWGIQDDLATAEKQWKQANETRQPEDEDFALVQEYRGTKIRKFAAFDHDSTVRAAEAFYENRTRYPYAWRKEASTRILARAQEHGVTLPDYLDRYLNKAAGFGYPTEESVDQAIVSRMNHAHQRHEQATEKLASVLGMIAENPVLRYNDELVKTAMQIMDQFDHEVGLADYSRVGLPEEMLGVTEPELRKMASENAYKVQMQNGAVVDVRELDSALLQAVDPSLTKLSQAELMDVIPTLPRPDADLIVRLSA